jgi:hypothetical protein
LLDLGKVAITIGKVTAIVSAIAALAAAIEVLVRKSESMFCSLSPNLLWCDPAHQLNIVHANFYSYANDGTTSYAFTDVSNNILLERLQRICDGKHHCEISTPQLFEEITHAPVGGNQGIQFHYYCGTLECDESSYRKYFHPLACPIKKCPQPQR